MSTAQTLIPQQSLPLKKRLSCTERAMIRKEERGLHVILQVSRVHDSPVLSRRDCHGQSGPPERKNEARTKSCSCHRVGTTNDDAEMDTPQVTKKKLCSTSWTVPHPCPGPGRESTMMGNKRDRRRLSKLPVLITQECSPGVLKIPPTV